VSSRLTKKEKGGSREYSTAFSKEGPQRVLTLRRNDKSDRVGRGRGRGGEGEVTLAIRGGKKKGGKRGSGWRCLERGRDMERRPRGMSEAGKGGKREKRRRGDLFLVSFSQSR